MNGYTVTPHHRQNRRRERPGSRTRRTITRKAGVTCDLQEELRDARDADYYLPSDKSRPSPLLRQNFNQSWQRWQARKAEEIALAEMDMMQLEKEQLMRFGGELGDDELCRLGILYNVNGGLAQDYESNTIACDVPVKPTAPKVTYRYGNLRPSRRHSALRSLLRCSPPPLSFMSDDANIARLSIQASPTPTIQPCRVTPVFTNVPL